TPLGSQSRTGFKPVAAGALPRGNASNSAQFGKNEDGSERGTPSPRLRVAVELVSQAETKRHDPFWDAPKLVPAFVTQLLGQMMEQEQTRLLRTPYGNRKDNCAGLLDTRF
ncbi:MAG TPA: hypothetical protein VHM27_14400, partial [Rhizomicrobium sp.]|nr:hypothetical protein [Rhizomicrobium sp.]